MDGALVGRSLARISKKELPAYLVQRVARLRGTSIEQGLLYAWIGSERFVSYVDSVKTHTAIPHISPRDIREFQICLPNLRAEQRRIARALEDADDLVATVERSLRKNEAIKRGMTQQLLTAKRRLPGFGEKWREHPMGSLGSTYGGLTGKKKDDFGFGVGRYVPFMAVMSDIHVAARSLLRVRIAPGERQNEVRPGDLLFNTSSETPNELAICAVAGDLPKNTYLNSFCFGFRLSPTVSTDALFLAYVFRSEVGRSLMGALAQGATRYNLSKSQFRNVAVTLPEMEEQRAIASALHDADKVLSALRERLAKARAVKQGMTQQLLSGNTRLAVEELQA
jgi:type I restriction enzyme S subunit